MMQQKATKTAKILVLCVLVSGMAMTSTGQSSAQELPGGEIPLGEVAWQDQEAQASKARPIALICGSLSGHSFATSYLISNDPGGLPAPAGVVNHYVATFSVEGWIDSYTDAETMVFSDSMSEAISANADDVSFAHSGILTVQVPPEANLDSLSFTLHLEGVMPAAEVQDEVEMRMLAVPFCDDTGGGGTGFLPECGSASNHLGEFRTAYEYHYRVKFTQSDCESLDLVQLIQCSLLGSPTMTAWMASHGDGAAIQGLAQYSIGVIVNEGCMLEVPSPLIPIGVDMGEIDRGPINFTFTGDATSCEQYNPPGWDWKEYRYSFGVKLTTQGVTYNGNLLTIEASTAAFEFMDQEVDLKYEKGGYETNAGCRLALADANTDAAQDLIKETNKMMDNLRVSSATLDLCYLAITGGGYLRCTGEMPGINLAFGGDPFGATWEWAGDFLFGSSANINVYIHGQGASLA